MNYRYVNRNDYEDFSSGSVLYGKPGLTNYPVRLACEIFMRCLEHMEEAKHKVNLYDPCCGGGYLLTVIGFLCGDKINAIYGTDIAKEAVATAKQNLMLLHKKGLISRQEDLQKKLDAYRRESHRKAIESAERLMTYTSDEISCYTFQSDALAPSESCKAFLPAMDIIITDVPYGQKVAWSTDEAKAIEQMLQHFSNLLKDTAIIAISSDKKQKIESPYFKRIEKFQVGKRKIEIIKKVKKD